MVFRYAPIPRKGSGKQQQQQKKINAPQERKKALILKSVEQKNGFHFLIGLTMQPHNT